jgi:uncharacterized membrane protein
MIEKIVEKVEDWAATPFKFAVVVLALLTVLCLALLIVIWFMTVFPVVPILMAALAIYLVLWAFKK